MSQSKIPRIALDKARGDSPADRRKAVAAFGDALREDGACRILLPEGKASDAAALADAGPGLLEILEEYFGLQAGSLTSLVAPIPPARATFGSRDLLALCVVGPGEPVAIETRRGHRQLAARAGEWIVAPGPALETLTAGVVAAVALHPGREDGAELTLTAEATVTLQPLAAFAPAG